MCFRQKYLENQHGLDIRRVNSFLQKHHYYARKKEIKRDWIFLLEENNNKNCIPKHIIVKIINYCLKTENARLPNICNYLRFLNIYLADNPDIYDSLAYNLYYFKYNTNESVLLPAFSNCDNVLEEAKREFLENTMTVPAGQEDKLIIEKICQKIFNTYSNFESPVNMVVYYKWRGKEDFFIPITIKQRKYKIYTHPVTKDVQETKINIEGQNPFGSFQEAFKADYLMEQ